MNGPRSAKDTIAAIATPPGEGGVAVVRISGPDSRTILETIFRSHLPGFAGFKPHTLHHGRIIDDQNQTMDDALAVLMPGPASYTGDDVVEIHCHGGRAVPGAILERSLALGARMADRGEFTLRAFLNGRMDLTQAEAVAELIHAPGRTAARLAQAKLSGLLGTRIRELRSELENLRRQLCVAVDFPEEEIECLSPEEISEACKVAIQRMDLLLESFNRAKAWRDGALAVLVGRVNAGKSSILNGLLGRERAIVTDRPGTTRDYIEEHLELDGLRIRLTDTAGLRDSGDSVEQAGIHMSRELSRQADLVLLVVDGSNPIFEEDLALIPTMGLERTLGVINKTDLDPAKPSVNEALTDSGLEVVSISAKTGTGLDTLAKRIRERITTGNTEPDPDEAAPNARQARAIESARADLLDLQHDVTMSIPYDLMGVRLESACTSLSEITGEITPASILDSIFDDFCIGK